MLGAKSFEVLNVSHFQDKFEVQIVIKYKLIETLFSRSSLKANLEIGCSKRVPSRTTYLLDYPYVLLLFVQISLSSFPRVKSSMSTATFHCRKNWRFGNSTEAGSFAYHRNVLVTFSRRWYFFSVPRAFCIVENRRVETVHYI